LDRIGYSFLIILCAALFALLPFTGAVHSLLTDLRDDKFTIETTGNTSASVQLYKPIYEDDTSSIEMVSHDTGDAPVYSSYNATNRQLTIEGLAPTATRVIDVTYDVDAINNSSFSTAITVTTYIWLVMIALFALGGLVWLWWHPVKERMEA
jgi:hypothetical protein